MVMPFGLGFAGVLAEQAGRVSPALGIAVAVGSGVAILVGLAVWLKPLWIGAWRKLKEGVVNLFRPSKTKLKKWAQVMVGVAALHAATANAGPADVAALTNAVLQGADLSYETWNGFRSLSKSVLNDPRLPDLLVKEWQEIKGSGKIKDIPTPAEVRSAYHRAAVHAEGHEVTAEFAAALEGNRVGLVVVTPDNLKEAEAIAAKAQADGKTVAFVSDPEVYPSVPSVIGGIPVTMKKGALAKVGPEEVLVHMSAVIAAAREALGDRMKAPGFVLGLPSGATLNWEGVEKALQDLFVLVVMEAMSARKFTLEEFKIIDQAADLVAAMA